MIENTDAYKLTVVKIEIARREPLATVCAIYKKGNSLLEKGVTSQSHRSHSPAQRVAFVVKLKR